MYETFLCVAVRRCWRAETRCIVSCLASSFMQPAMAEYGWALSEKTQTKAREELNECPESCSLAVDAVREQIETRPDIG